MKKNRPPLHSDVSVRSESPCGRAITAAGLTQSSSMLCSPPSSMVSVKLRFKACRQSSTANSATTIMLRPWTSWGRDKRQRYGSKGTWCAKLSERLSQKKRDTSSSHSAFHTIHLMGEPMCDHFVLNVAHHIQHPPRRMVS